MRIFAIALFAAASAGAQPADLVLYNGKIVTGWAAKPVVNTVAIRGGKFVRANVVPACKDCNSAKQSLLPWEWNAYLERLARPDTE